MSAAIVIGAGVGGIAAAIRLAARGYDTTVVEALDAPGGRAYVFRQDGYVFDAGPTIITAPYLFEELWRVAGRELRDDIELKALDPFYQIRFDDGVTFNYRRDEVDMLAEISKFAPDETENYKRYMQASERIYRTAFEKLADHPFHTFGTMLAEFPDLIRLGGMQTVYQKVSRYFTNEKMRIAFSFHPLLIGGNPLTTTAYYCLIGHLERAFGVHYVMGGTGALVQGMANLAEGLGARFRFETKVRQIAVDQGRATGVVLENGERLDADIVVSNVDPATTYRNLLSTYPRKRWTDGRLSRKSYSMSLFVWYFGCNRRWEDVYHHIMILGPRYRGLLNDIFGRKHLAEDFSLYLHRPTASDPALAPDGCDAFYVLSPVPNLESGVDWTQEAEPYRKAIERRLSETVLPGLEDSIVTSRVMTPLDFRDRLHSEVGAGFSMEPQLVQSAWFRPHNASEEVDGLYLVGAGT
ncbi:MAG: phytoene desaturase family protein, partial [Pseudomonadota bacterium]